MEATQTKPAPKPSPVHSVKNGEHHPNSENSGSEHHEEVIPHDLPRPSTLTVAIVAVVFCLLLAALFVIGYIPRHLEANEAASDAQAKANDAPVVSVVPAKESLGGKDLLLPADIAAYQDTSLFARTNGYLKKMHVDIQDHVKQGDLLAEIDTPEVDAQLQQSKASLEQANASVETSQANWSLAKSTADRYELANKNQPGSVTQEDLDTHRSQFQQAVAALKQAQANVGVAQADVQRLTVLQGFEKIYAPFNGTITARGYYDGALLNSNGTGAALFRIQQTDPLKVWVQVPQSYADQIQTGQDAFLRVRNHSDKEFKGTVARTAQALDQSTRTMTFELHFPNPDGQLFPGMYGEVRLTVSQTKPVIVIPTSAMVFNASGTQVAVVKDGKAHFQKITVGRDLGTELEVVDGISKEDQIISNPGERLTEGGEVQVNQPKAQTAEQPKVETEKVAQKS